MKGIRWYSALSLLALTAVIWVGCGPSSPPIPTSPPGKTTGPTAMPVHEDITDAAGRGARTVTSSKVQGESALVPHHIELFSLDSGVHDNQENQSAATFRGVAQSKGAPWLQLHFSDYNLGEESYITVTSLQDGDEQTLDSEALESWQDSTAYFNGDAVEVELTVAQGESGIFIQIQQITVGDWVEQAEVTTTEDSEPRE